MKPVIIVSSCIEKEAVRYNGGIIRSQVVAALQDEITVRSVCPEVAIGLGVPRESIRLVQSKAKNKTIFLQQKTNIDYTDEMENFSRNFAEECKTQPVDGFILKSSSPSCGLNSVKVYSDHPKSSPIHKNGRGVFGSAVLQNFPGVAIEDEDRLRNEKIYDHFLNRVFTHARFRMVMESEKMKDLVEFHSNHKYLLMAYNQSRLRILGKITANNENRAPREVIREYYDTMTGIFKKTYSNKNLINAYEHMMGYFKEGLSSDEKQLFLNSMEQFRQGRANVESLRSMMNQWVLRFKEPYLSKQVILNPYPATLNYTRDKHDKSYSIIE